MRIYVFAVLLMSSFPSFSQNCDFTLTGIITDLHDGSVLEGATLIVAGSELTVVTDFEGKFIITNLCSDTYSIQVSHPYCLTKGFRVRVTGDTFKSFKLEHHLEELNEITIDGKITTKQSKTLQESNIVQEELERFSSKTLGDALNSLSGVSSLNTGNTVVKPMINGLHSSRVVIINNGARMEDQEWGVEHAPNIDINAVNRLTLIKGAGALQYSGDAMGGVIIVESSKVPIKDSLYGKTLVAANSNGKGSLVTSNLTKSYESGWFATFQGSLKRSGDSETPDYVLSNTGENQHNLSVKVGLNRFAYGMNFYYTFFKNEIGILRASHLGSAQDLFRAIQSDLPLVTEDFTYDFSAPKQNVSHQLARFVVFKRIGFGKLSLQYDYQRNDRLEFDIRRGSDKGKASLDLQLQTHRVLLDFDSNLSNNVGLKTGIMGSYQKNYAANTGVRRLIPDYKKYDFGIYAVSDYQLNSNWLFEVGARYDFTHMDVYKFYRTSFWELRNYDVNFPNVVIEELVNQVLTRPQFNFHNTSATFGATYDFGEDYKLFFNYSLASRTPNPSELFSEGLHHSAARVEYGDLGFNSEVGHKLSVTLERINKNFSFSINPFINTISDFILIEPVGINNSIRGTFPVWEYRQTNAHFLGIDFNASYVFSDHMSFNNRSSLVKGYDRFRDKPLINIPPVNTINEIVYYNSKLKNLRLAVQSEYVFRQNEYPDTNFEIYIPQTETRELVDVSTPPDAYHLFNFNSSIDFDFSEKSKLSLGFGISNLFNISYRNYLNRLRFYADDLGRNFLLNIKYNY